MTGSEETDPAQQRGSVKTTMAVGALMPMVGIPIFIAQSNQTMISVALPAIGADIGELSRLPWLVVGYMLAMTVTGPLYGALGDMKGRRRILQLALSVYIVGTVLCVFAQGLPMLAVGRMLQGLGGGGLISLPQALIGQYIEDRYFGKAQGYVATIGIVSATAGPMVGGVLVEYAGWRSVFAFTLPLAILAIVLVARLPGVRVERKGRKFDYAGFAWLNLFVISLTVGLDILRYPDRRLWAGAMGALAVVALVGLVRSQMRASNPLFPPRLLRLAPVWRIVVMIVCHGAAVVSVGVILPLNQRILYGDDNIATAHVLLALSAGLGVGGTTGGNLISWTGRTALFATLGLMVCATSLFSLAFTTPELGRAMLILLSFLIGFGMGTAPSMGHTTMQGTSPGDLRGAAAGMLTFSRSIGAVTGTACASLALFAFADVGSWSPAEVARLLENPELIPPENLALWRSGFRAAFLTISGFVCVGFLMAATQPVRRVEQLGPGA